MQMQIQGQIMGVKRFSGQIEGKNFDYCRVIVATPLDSTQGNALGSATTEYDFGASTNFEQFKAHQFPIDAFQLTAARRRLDGLKPLSTRMHKFQLTAARRRLVPPLKPLTGKACIALFR